jgi:hypothetical protein
MKLEMYKNVAKGEEKRQIERIEKKINESMRNVKNKITSIGQTNAHINIFYLRDKVLEHRILHERFEALTVL